jgi:hypothetical protein
MRSKRAPERWTQAFTFSDAIQPGDYVGITRRDSSGELHVRMVPLANLGTERDPHVIPGVADPDYEELIHSHVERREVVANAEQSDVS